MRSAVLGLLLCPVAAVTGYALTRPAPAAFAHPVAERPAGKVARAFEGRFYAGATLTPDGEIPAIERRACRVAAPGLGERAVYVEETFATDLSRPFSQRLLVIDDAGGGAARVREFTFRDPASAQGLCQRADRAPVEASALQEREGCSLIARVRGDRVEARTDGESCPSMLNGAHHASRTVVTHRSYLRVHDRGVDARGRTVWGDAVAPRHYVKVSATAAD